MRIAYIFDPLLPRTQTDTEQALNTVMALMDQGVDVTMFLPRQYLKKTSAKQLQDYYRLEQTPNVVFQRSFYQIPEIYFGRFTPSRALEKSGHALRTLLNRQLRHFDLVYTRNIPIAIAALLAGHRVIYETYRPWPKQYPAMRPLLKTMMRHHRFLGAVLHSTYTRDVFTNIGIAKQALIVVHNGYRPTLFEPRLDQATARAAIGLQTTKPLIVYTGRVTVSKGLDLVLAVAKKMPEIDFMFVGSEQHGEIEERAKYMANVHIVPWVAYDQLAPYLFAADILLIPPSLGPLKHVGNTVLPMKLFLYLAAGRPILAPRAPDTAEILQHNVNAWLVTPDEAQATVDGIRKLLAQPTLANRLGKAAQEQAQDFTWDARAKKIVAFIKQRLSAQN